MKKPLAIIIICLLAVNLISCGAVKDYEDINIALNEENAGDVTELYNSNGVHVFKVDLIYDELDEGTNVIFESMVAVTETEEGKYKDLEILSITTNLSDKHDYYGMKIYPLEDEGTIKIGAVHNGCSFPDNEQELLEIVKDKETDGFIKYDLKKIDRINE